MSLPETGSPTHTLDAQLRPWLQARQGQHNYRTRGVLEGPQGVRIRMNGRALLSFCSNDYLALANHPQVAKAFQEGIEQYGSGSGAAHLISGHTAAHHALEEALAEFVGRPRALLFSTGYMANLAVISSLCERHDQVFEDRFNHHSLLDGALLSGARLVRYRHVDMEHLQTRLAAARAARRLLVTDGVFSMDGDLAPLPQLAELAAQFNAWLMVDDAHGLGVMGPQGRGSVAHYGLSEAQVPVLVGTLGKAFGTFGAFVAGSETLIEYLIQRAGPYIYTTAPPAALAVATRASLELVLQADAQRQHLHELISYFRQGASQIGLALIPGSSPIQPVLLGDSARAVRWSQSLLEDGFYVSAIRPPTVAEGSARLRITFSAAHDRDDVEQLLLALARLQAQDAR